MRQLDAAALLLSWCRGEVGVGWDGALLEETSS